MKTVFYHIIDLDIIGKEEEFVPYIYSNEKGWVVDKDNILSDRIIGYDGDSIGSSDMLFRVEKITEEEAMKILGINN